MSTARLHRRKPQTREKSADAVSAYYGDVQKLLAEWESGEVIPRIRTFSQTSFDELIYALRLLTSVPESVTIVHGPRGCAAAQLYHTVTGSIGETAPWAVTNLSERQTIMGGEKELREAIVRLYRRYRPKTVFILATPAVAINNDDIQSAANEYSEEFDIDVIPVYTNGFRSNVAVTGYDAALSAVASGEKEEHESARKDTVTIISAAETGGDLREFSRLLEELGLTVNVLPAAGTSREGSTSVHAGAVLGLDPDHAEAYGRLAEQAHGIPYVEAGIPIGIAGTTNWLTAVGKALGLETEAEGLAERETNLIRPQLDPFHLNGAKVYVALSGSAALAVADLIEELGGQIAGISLDHADRIHAKALEVRLKKQPDLPIHVSSGQTFEEANLLSKLKPDLYIGGIGRTVWAAKAGIPAVSLDKTPIKGYQGTLALARLLSKALKNPTVAGLLANRKPQPYPKGWLTKSPQWYIKQEVR